MKVLHTFGNWTCLCKLLCPCPELAIDIFVDGQRWADYMMVPQVFDGWLCLCKLLCPCPGLGIGIFVGWQRLSRLPQHCAMMVLQVFGSWPCLWKLWLSMPRAGFSRAWCWAVAEKTFFNLLMSVLQMLGSQRPQSVATASAFETELAAWDKWLESALQAVLILHTAGANFVRRLGRADLCFYPGNERSFVQHRFSPFS